MLSFEETTYQSETMITKEGIRTSNSSNPVISVAIFISEHCCSAAVPETPTNYGQQTKVTQTGLFFANNRKGIKLDSPSSHLALLQKWISIVIKKELNPGTCVRNSTLIHAPRQF